MELFGNWLWGWYDDPDNQNKSNAIATALGVLLVIAGAVFAAIWYFVKRVAGKFNSEPGPNPDSKLGVEEFLEMQRVLMADLEKKYEAAHSEEKAQFLTQMEVLKKRIAEPEKALAEAQVRIAELENVLQRSGNSFEPEQNAKAQAALECGDYSAADNLFAKIEAQHELDVQASARAAFGRGLIAEEQVRWGDAADHYAKAARLDPTYDTLLKAGMFLGRAGRHGAAIQSEEILVTVARAEFGDTSEKTAVALNNLAASYRAAGRVTDAEPLYREALATNRKTLGTAHPDTATSLNNLAGLLQAKGDYDGAEPLFREALATTRKTLGTAHPDYATHLNNLAGLLRAKGDYDGAEPLFGEAVAVVEAALGAQHPNSKLYRNNLALFLAEQAARK